MIAEEYPPIAEHGLIGDLQTAALVCTDGTIDWFCCPRFDSPSIFAALLDRKKGGHFRIAPRGTHFTTRQLYYPDTAVLVTRFMAPAGVAEVVDFMPAAEEATPTNRHRMVRAVRVVRGEVDMEVDCVPRFDYGRRPHQLEVTDDGAVFRSGEMQVTLHSTFKLARDGDGVRASQKLRVGDV